ncbi:hypothetical protein CFP56_007131 [Quercus suber]|uniref:Zinc knuckle CX2CX4HX4C domain-containing protein n=1 Tax=Quercus suber TaxID=58331 RepID=A0AAW0L611_QUESU
MRVRVDLPLDKPLRRGANIVTLEGEKTWVTFRYERLPTFCFQYGWLGHNEKHCQRQPQTSNSAKQYGEWMRAHGNQKGNSEKPKTQNNWGFDEERSGKSSGHSAPATATYSNPGSSLRSRAEIQNDSQIDKGVMPNVADRLEGTASQSIENQGCNSTVPRSENSSRDTQRVNALEGNISDELSLVGLSSSAPHEAQEISSPLKPLLEKTISLVSSKAPSGPSQTKQPKGKVNLKRIARDKGKQAHGSPTNTNKALSEIVLCKTSNIAKGQGVFLEASFISMIPYRPSRNCK